MKKTLIAAAVMGFSLAVSAQEPASRIALTPYVFHDIESIPHAASSALERKLVSMATANGFAGTSDVFVITAVPEVMDVQMTPTAPAQFAVDMEVEVYVLNNPEEVIVGQTVYSLKGVGASEQKAVINAISQTDTRRFMENAKEKIIGYYSSKLPAVVAKAQFLASMTRYDEALAVLSAVPDCIDEYISVTELMTDIYTMRIDRDADILLRKAEASLAEEDTTAALAFLVKIDPYSTRAEDADAVVARIKADTEALRARDLQREIEEYELNRKMAMLEYENSVELSKIRLEAAREIGAEAFATPAAALVTPSAAGAPEVSGTRDTSEDRNGIFDNVDVGEIIGGLAGEALGWFMKKAFKMK